MIKDHYAIIKAPVVTEKAMSQGDTGNKYVFYVDVHANKKTIKEAIEKVYEVTVTGVNTSRQIGKIKTQGRYKGRRPMRKKAFITLKDGDTIEVVQGL